MTLSMKVVIHLDPNEKFEFGNLRDTNLEDVDSESQHYPKAGDRT